MKEELIFFWGLIKYNRKILLWIIIIRVLKDYFPKLNVGWYIVLVILILAFIVRFFSYFAFTFRRNLKGRRVSLTSPTTGKKVIGKVIEWTNENDEFWIKTETGETVYVSVTNKSESDKLNLKLL